jgi:Photosynthetic reaction centre cytochrome C subunit
MKTRLFWVAATICLIAGALSLGAAGAAPLKAQSTAKNLMVLKDMSDDDVFATMQSWAGQTGMQCNTCHVAGDNSSDQKAQKVTARKMYTMVRLLNEQDFFKNGSRKADCYLCHKGNQHIGKTPAGN